ncbi:MAG: prolyl-tRNA synthetase [Candidatus Nealsonbacteria bacterium CG23_combo_of_CG06-09_8_20_14_all_39_17]|uniref:Proline--tRNA ligase n=1 Tax=Candidatus Nealsonbacteria bacterium CG23_combo_of_CG06-09_8_20_14_all_39_17 TaxID=1974722 RepID=A0A2G9YUX2_9BACT|nr:MAG: prolyl-tRNA synthetase [Candidatus Nealsonbacteria bacterium CG23_combo_of_CG06-09_8_20_14_all_39_17]PIU44217.1 MAG: prolyl-tRNA synthetase [Candidatus Nealsonbacteria bacterium CG07_land_8_20_14_0_80_39_13]
MRQSQLFTKTKKEAPKDEVSKNAQLLIRAGFVNKELAGAYAYLPLGIRVINKISNIIREEMNAVGGQELIMTALQDKETWGKTGRWSDDVVDNWFKTSLKNGTELGLGFSHEEVLAKLMKNHISSYKDLPIYVYQIQTKFRNEARAKSGLMRGREFMMKDLYSFSRSKEDHEEFYEKMKEVYMKVFNRLGMGDKTYITISSGGSFSKYSYEFQTLSEAGEDVVYIIDEKKRIAINKDDFNDEVIKDFGLSLNKDNLVGKKSIEVGDIYTLGYKYSEAFNLTYKNEEGKDELVFMGSYGMSPSRLMGAVVELNNDEKGIIWPETVAPFRIHLIAVGQDLSIKENSDKIYEGLKAQGIEVLYDDREGASAGEKFADSDLIGIPCRVVISKKTLAENSVEIKQRKEKEVKLVKIDDLLEEI